MSVEYVDQSQLKAHLEKVVPLMRDPSGEEAGPWLRPFVWREPSQIPPREWLYGSHYLRDYLTATFAPGAAGKSALAIVEGLAMATGRNLVGVEPEGRFKVAYWNGEDPLEETERRIAAAMSYYGIRPDEIAGHYFYGSGRESGLVIAEQTVDGTVINRPVVDRVKAAISQFELDVVQIDPFVSSHRVTENDNNAVDLVAKEWGRIAGACHVSVEVIHHTTKAALGREVKVEDGRGGGALLFAARSARVLNTMSEEEAAQLGLTKARRYYFRVDNGKANLTPPPERSSWFKFEGVALGNGPDGGDNIGVVTKFDWPDHTSPASQGPNRNLKFAGQRVMAAFWRLVDEGRTSPAPAAPGVRPGTVAVTDGDLRRQSISLGLITEPKPAAGAKDDLVRWQASARQAWARGTKEVQESGHLRFEDGFWWSPRFGRGSAAGDVPPQ